MMSELRLGALAVAALVGVSFGPAFGGIPSPICRQPDVLDAAAERFRAHDPYAQLLRDSVTETPTFSPTIFSCTAYLQQTSYDAARAGLMPMVVLVTKGFTVRQQQHGFEVAVP